MVAHNAHTNVNVCIHEIKTITVPKRAACMMRVCMLYFTVYIYIDSVTMPFVHLYSHTYVCVHYIQTICVSHCTVKKKFVCWFVVMQGLIISE